MKQNKLEKTIKNNSLFTIISLIFLILKIITVVLFKVCDVNLFYVPFVLCSFIFAIVSKVKNKDDWALPIIVIDIFLYIGLILLMIFAREFIDFKYWMIFLF